MPGDARLSHHMHTLPPHIVRPAAEGFDAYVEWTRTRSSPARATRPNTLRHLLCESRTPWPPIENNTLSLPMPFARSSFRSAEGSRSSAVDVSGPAFIEGQVLVLTKAVAPSEPLDPGPGSISPGTNKCACGQVPPTRADQASRLRNCPTDCRYDRHVPDSTYSKNLLDANQVPTWSGAGHVEGSSRARILMKPRSRIRRKGRWG